MGWFSTVVVGVITAVLGCVGAGFVANKCARWYRIPSFEGASGYYVVLIALLGLVVGLIVGIVCARIVASGEGPGFPKGLGLATGSMGGLVLVSGIVAWLAADLPPEIDGHSLELMVEVRGPKDFTVPVPKEGERAFANVHVPHGRSQPTGDLRLDEARQVEGRWIVTATVPLQTSVAQKYLRVYFNRENDPLFRLRLRRHPSSKDFEWSEWVESGWDVGKPEPAPEQKFKLRFRVQTVIPPPPGPTQKELDAEAAAEEQAKFEAIAADAPITEWLPYTRYGAAEGRLHIAVERMTARPGFVEELASLMISADPRVAADALRLVEHIPALSNALTDAVAAAGRSIASLIRKVNATSVEEDPNFFGAAEVSVRFSAWMVAVRALREKAGGDFTAELREILELSRMRTDSQVMRGDVLRVASYYLHKWTGLEPLPTDPKPR